MQIAISGPAGAGKGTIARTLARTMRIAYVDAGLIFRGVAYAKAFTKNFHYAWDGREANLTLGGKIITPILRSEDAALAASRLAENAQCLREMETAVEAIASQFPRLVCDGRNAGTTILPRARFKFYVTADAEVRATRRMHDIIASGQVAPYEVVLHQVLERDKRDRERIVHPFIVPPGAIVIDTSILSVEDTVVKMVRIINQPMTRPR